MASLGSKGEAAEELDVTAVNDCHVTSDYAALAQVCSPEEVLQFWFHGEQRANYRDKWFPSQGVAQTKIDLEIYSRFNSTLEAAKSGDLDSWKSKRMSYVALIVVLDQFSRHIYRHLGLPSDAIERKNADAAALLAATDLSSQLLHSLPASTKEDQGLTQDDGSVVSSYDDEGRLTMAQYVFSMMPFRHSATPERLTFVLSSMETFSAQFTWETELLSRFRKQTIRRLQHLQDRASAEAAESILAHDYFAVDLENPVILGEILKNKLVTAVLQFLDAHSSEEHDVPICISLSGGVDSMVILRILAVLRDHGKRKIHGIAAMHIDYANRSESKLEADYVEWYCKQLGVDFHKRVINEVTRGITDRTEYERISREIRYSFYREVLSQTGGKGVIFGHHQGDVQENVISNIMRGGSCLQLSGMGFVGLTNGVMVWRPLLAHSKDDIYAFSHSYGVPYFRDTTPTWSTRGKLRNQLVPLLIDMYGTGCLNSLSSLAADSDSTRILVESNVYAPLLDTVKRFPCGLRVNIAPFVHQSSCFWREVLKTLMHSMGMSMVRDKAVGIFTDRVQGKRRVGGQEVQGKEKGSSGPADPAVAFASGWLELRKNFNVELSSAGDLTVFREEVLQPCTDTNLRISVAEVRLPRQKTEGKETAVGGFAITLGSWMVTVTIRTATGDGGSTSPSNVRILQAPHELLSGSFEYELALPPGCDWIELLAAREGGRKTGAGKPPAPLIGMDLRLRAGLPLLVPERTDAIAESAEESKEIVHFQYAFLESAEFEAPH
jgi:tRNA(Ile)-lysidine synthetase-like protein